MTHETDHQFTAQHCNDFVQGLLLLKENLVSQALSNFQRAYESAPDDDIFYNKYASYCGLARVLGGDRSGVILCRDAARLEAVDGDVFLNLAFVEWHLNSRKRTIYTLEKGLMVDHQHPGLNKLKQHLGIRCESAFAFISRDSFLNNVLGRLSRKKINSTEYWTYQQFL